MEQTHALVRSVRGRDPRSGGCGLPTSGQLYGNERQKEPGLAAQAQGPPGNAGTRTPFSVTSHRHELGRLAIQETNKAQDRLSPPQMNKNNLCAHSQGQESAWKEPASFFLPKSLLYRRGDTPSAFHHVAAPSPNPPSSSTPTHGTCSGCAGARGS